MTSHLLPTYARTDLAFERGEGVCLTDTASDISISASGIAVTALGHAHPHLVEALNEQADKSGIRRTSTGFPEGERLAERLGRDLRRHRVLRQFGRRGE